MPWQLPARILAVAAHDVFMAAASFEIALWLRFQTYGLPQPFFFMVEATLLFALVAGIVFWWVGLYRGIWYYASASDLIAIVKGVTLAILVFLPLLFLLTRLQNFPRTALLILWPLLIVLLAGPRFLYRMAKDGNLAVLFERHDDGHRVPVLLIGAGDRADTFIREMARSRVAGYRVVGIVDDKPGRVGRDIRGVRVEGQIEDLAAIVARLEERGRRPQRALIAWESPDGALVGRALEACEQAGLTLASLPRLTDFRQEGAEESLRVRPVDLEDLLRRPQRKLDRDAMAALIAGKRVLVTGAGGTIGGELVRQVAALGPSHLALLDLGEFNLYAIDLELAMRAPGLARSAHLADVADRSRLDDVFRAVKPDLVFHAAALKHVPIVEANPVEGIRANALGSRNVADACVALGVGTMVLISTDKAVNPTNVMGATKRIAEMYGQALSLARSHTRFVTVRFGNVLGSTGSVVPLFQRQIAAGGPVTVTHPDMTRYFMTVQEAVELVLQASAMETEAGRIFVLDMGEPVKIVELARQMIRLAGLRPEKDVAIAFTGLRPGEKLAESLFHDAEPPASSGRDGILTAAPRTADWHDLVISLDRLAAATQANRREEALALLKTLVPEYRKLEPSNDV
ncbi:MAG: polysaccharide biosynthesis protein [Alphaproteobacteria bacterium]|nr:polysaccharide biosynthesis protein [Alphaproteobacteria bacterium]